MNANEIPAGMERVSVVTDDRTGARLFQVERSDGTFYLCDEDGEYDDVPSWTLVEVLGLIDADDPDAFFELVEKAL